MAIIKGDARQTSGVSRLGEGGEAYMRMLRDGTVGIADLIALWSLEGRVFTANAGTGTSAVTFGAGTLDLTEQDLIVVVPSGTAIIPLECNVVFDTLGTAQIVEVVMQKGTGGVAGAGTSVTPKSSNENAGLSSACTVTSACATGTALTAVDVEIWHDGAPLGITIATVGQIRVQHAFRYSAKDSGCLQVVGPSEQLVVFASAQAGVGFISLKYVELPSSSIV